MNYTDSVPLTFREKEREDFDFGAFRSVFHLPHLKIREARPKPQGTAGRRTKKPQETGADAS